MIKLCPKQMHISKLQHTGLYTIFHTTYEASVYYIYRTHYTVYVCSSTTSIITPVCDKYLILQDISMHFKFLTSVSGSPDKKSTTSHQRFMYHWNEQNITDFHTNKLMKYKKYIKWKPRPTKNKNMPDVCNRNFFWTFTESEGTPEAQALYWQLMIGNSQGSRK